MYLSPFEPSTLATRASSYTFKDVYLLKPLRLLDLRVGETVTVASGTLFVSGCMELYMEVDV